MQEETKFALLIDADNISDKYIKTILDELSAFGVATYKRIYGDWTSTRLAAWKPVLLDTSIIPIQQYSYTFGKNATDSAMIIDAMDILYSGNVGGFCLATSDSDFTRLAARLRESGMMVVGMGESKTPKAFIAACNQFKYLDILYSGVLHEERAAAAERAAEPAKTPAKSSSRRRRGRGGAGQAAQTGVEAPSAAETSVVPETAAAAQAAPAAPEVAVLPSASESAAPKTPSAQTRKAPTPPAPPEPGPEQEAKPLPEAEDEPDKPQPQTGLKTVRRAILAIVNDSSDEDGWMFTGDIGNQIAKRYPDFDVRNYGYSKLTPFLESLGVFEVKRERASENNNIQLVYVKRK